MLQVVGVKQLRGMSQLRLPSAKVRCFVPPLSSSLKRSAQQGPERKNPVNCGCLVSAPFSCSSSSRFRTILASATSSAIGGRQHFLSSRSERRLKKKDLFVGCQIVSDCNIYSPRTYCTSRSQCNNMELPKVVDTLKSMASLSLAGSWDNVGLLLEPTPPHSVSKLLLTNDLTPSVMQEAIDKGVNMIVSYHPPIFAPVKRVTQSSWKERIVASCLERRIALYSPHTSWDAVADGVNDWLISAFDVREVTPVEQTEQTAGGCNKKLTIWTTSVSADTLAGSPILCENPNTKVYMEPVKGAGGESLVTTKMTILCSASAVPTILAAVIQHNISLDSVECSDLAKLPTLGYGMGRVGHLQSPISVDEAVAAIKSHLQLKHVRLAQAAGTEKIRTVAVCAGSGGSVLRGVKADLYLTGEMSHHEVLDAVCKGTNVVLCDHSNTERGFLKNVQERLTKKLEGKVEVVVSEKDRDPLLVV